MCSKLFEFFNSFSVSVLVNDFFLTYTCTIIKKNQVIFISSIFYTNNRGNTLFLPLTQHTDLLLSFSPVKSINKSMILNPTNRVYHLVFQQFRNKFFYTVMYLLKFQVKVWEHFSASA